jgi:hypothetical protein
MCCEITFDQTSLGYALSSSLEELLQVFRGPLGSAYGPVPSSTKPVTEAVRLESPGLPVTSAASRQPHRHGFQCHADRPAARPTARCNRHTPRQLRPRGGPRNRVPVQIDSVIYMFAAPESCRCVCQFVMSGEGCAQQVLRARNTQPSQLMLLLHRLVGSCQQAMPSSLLMQFRRCVHIAEGTHGNISTVPH